MTADGSPSTHHIQSFQQATKHTRSTSLPLLPTSTAIPLTPRRLRRFCSNCSPLTLCLPILTIFFLIASSTLSQNPSNDPLEVLEDLHISTSSPFRDKFYKAPLETLGYSLEGGEGVDGGIVVEAVEGRHTVTVVCLHGLGDENHELLQIVTGLKEKAPWVKW